MDLAIEKVCKEFNIGGGERMAAVKDVGFSLSKGGILIVRGPSGSGKTTLLNLVAGLTKPTGGRIRFDGRDIWSMTDKEQSVLRAEKMGFIYQVPSLIPSLNVIDNIMLPTLFGRGKTDRKKEALRLLDIFSLKGYENRYPYQLSGGQHRRAAAARTFINDPELVLADEPTGDLDSEGENMVFDVFKEFNTERGTAFIIVTHSPELPDWMGRMLTMNNGRIENG